MQIGATRNPVVGFGSGAGDAIGVGRGAGSGTLVPTVFDGGSIVAQTAGQNIQPGDHVIVLKYEFGATDTVSAYAFPEGVAIDQDTFDRRAASASCPTVRGLVRREA